QPEGPYHLGGFSLGGTVAYEMAQQLRAAGEGVGLLALFDHAPRDQQERFHYATLPYALRCLRWPPSSAGRERSEGAAGLVSRLLAARPGCAPPVRPSRERDRPRTRRNAVGFSPCRSLRRLATISPPTRQARRDAVARRFPGREHV